MPPYAKNPVPPPNAPPLLDQFGHPKYPVDYSGVDLSDQEWPGVSLFKVNFDGARLDRANLRNLSVTRGKFRRASFVGANLPFCKFVTARFEKTSFAGATLPAARFSGFTLLQDVNLTAAVLDKARMEGPRIQNCDFSDSDAGSLTLRNCHVERSLFRGANLAFAEFVDCRLTACDFAGAFMAGAAFTRCQISSCHFTGAVLDGALFDDQSDYVDCKFCEAYVGSAEMPSELKSQAIQQGADFTSIDQV